MYNVVFDESFYSALAYIPQPHSEAMTIQLYVSYITYDTSTKGKTGNKITFTKFEEGNLLSETRNDTESGNEPDDDLTIAPLISEKEMDAISSSDESGAEPMSKYILEDIHDGSKSNPSINRREERYKIRDCFKQRKAE